VANAGVDTQQRDFGFSTNQDHEVLGNDPDRNGIPGDQPAVWQAERPGSAESMRLWVGRSTVRLKPQPRAEAAAAEAEAAGAKRGGYVTRNGIRARGYSEGGMINSDSSIEEGQVLPTSDIFSEGVYAQADINRSVDSENVVESDKVITAPVAIF
jgi:hypothetical protein